MLCIVIAALILFISEALPITATCFAILVAMKYTGVATLPEIMEKSASNAVFFNMAGFGIAGALQNTNLVNILMGSVYKLSNRNPRRMIQVVCIVTAFLSVFVANGVAQIVVISIVNSVIIALGNPAPGTSRLAGGMMMAIYVGATIGGMFLPSSNGPNVLLLELSEMISGKSMSFFQWAIFGVPCGLVLLLFAAWRLPRYYQPQELNESQKDNIEEVFNRIPGHLTRKDKAFLVIMVTMIILWFASNWYPQLEITTVAMTGVILMMMPGIDLLTAKDFKRNFSVMNVVILLCIFPMASCMSSSGVAEWIADRIFVNASEWSILTLLILATLTAFLVHCLVPAGSANSVLSASVIGPVLVSAGVPVSAAIVLIGIQAGTGFLFPIEGTWQYTFGTEHYSFSDCIKGNWMITVFGMITCIFLIPLLAVLYSHLGLIR